MKNIQLYRVALGSKNADYYLKKFSCLEQGNAWKACWNWSAFFFGPFWIAHRRIGYHYSFIFTFIFGFICIWGIDNFGQIIGGLISALAYIVLFPVVANYLYYLVIGQFIKENNKKHDEEILDLIKGRFETVTDKANRLRGY